MALKVVYNNYHNPLRSHHKAKEDSIHGYIGDIHLVEGGKSSWTCPPNLLNCEVLPEEHGNPNTFHLTCLSFNCPAVNLISSPVELVARNILCF